MLIRHINAKPLIEGIERRPWLYRDLGRLRKRKRGGKLKRLPYLAKPAGDWGGSPGPNLWEAQGESKKTCFIESKSTMRGSKRAGGVKQCFMQ